MVLGKRSILQSFRRVINLEKVLAITYGAYVY